MCLPMANSQAHGPVPHGTLIAGAHQQVHFRAEPVVYLSVVAFTVTVG